MVAGPAKRVWWDNYQYTSTGHQEIHLHGEVEENPPPWPGRVKGYCAGVQGRVQIEEIKVKNEEWNMKNHKKWDKILILINDLKDFAILRTNDNIFE